MTWLLLGLLLQDEAPAYAVRKAVDKTAAGAYYYKVSGKYERTGEFHPDAILSCTIRQYRSARHGARILVKGPEGLWKTPEERIGETTENPDREAADIVATLRDAEAPHAMVRELLGLLDKGRRSEDRTMDAVRCRVYAFKVRDDKLKEALDRQLAKAADAKTIAKPDSIHWTSMKSSVRVYVDAKDGYLVRVVDERSVKIGYKASGTEGQKPYRNEMEFVFSGYGEARVNLPKEVKDKLGIPD
jgi:hypothetical protein